MAKVWDAEAADITAQAFVDWLESLLLRLNPDQKKTLTELQSAWKEAYMTAGHKRLARVFLALSLT